MRIGVTAPLPMPRLLPRILALNAAAAAESMEEQAGNLSQAVSLFKLSQQAGRPARARLANVIPHTNIATKRQCPESRTKAGLRAANGDVTRSVVDISTTT